MPKPRCYREQLFAHKFRDLLAIDTFSVSPLHCVVRYFDYEAHERILTDAMVGEFFEIRYWGILAGLCDDLPALPLAFAVFNVRSGAAFLILAERS